MVTKNGQKEIREQAHRLNSASLRRCQVGKFRELACTFIDRREFVVALSEYGVALVNRETRRIRQAIQPGGHRPGRTRR